MTGLARNGLDTFKTVDEAAEYLCKTKGFTTREQCMKYLYEKIPYEKDYQKNIMEFLKSRYPKAFVWKAAAGAYSRGGIPDICAVIDGTFFGFEVKRPLLGKASALQKVTIKRITSAGGVAAVVSFPEEVQKIIERAKA